MASPSKFRKEFSDAPEKVSWDTLPDAETADAGLMNHGHASACFPFSPFLNAMPSISAIQSYFVSDPVRLQGEVLSLMRVTGRLSALMPKGEMPEGQGYNWETLLYDRSVAAESVSWTPIAPNNNQLPNTCNPTPLMVPPANTVYSFSPFQTLLESNQICMQDARFGYKFQQQVAAIRNNLKALIVDTWELYDKQNYFRVAAHKVVLNAAMTDYVESTDFGTALPTSQLNASFLRVIYEDLIRNAGEEEPVAMKNGAPQYMILVSPEAQQGVIESDPLVREDFRFAQMGEGSASWLLNTWNIDRSYAGFLMIVDPKMPRWDFNFATGQWISIPFYIQVPATNGFKLVPNPAYRNAPYEDSYVFLKSVVRRLMPKPFGTAGADTKFDPVNFNGDIVWRNIPNRQFNPLSLTGSWFAPLEATYEPLKPLFGYILRGLRCNPVYLSSCY